MSVFSFLAIIMSYIINTTENTTNFSANFTNVLFCHGTGYHLAHIPGIGLVGTTSLNNICKFERIISF